MPSPSRLSRRPGAAPRRSDAAAMPPALGANKKAPVPASWDEAPCCSFVAQARHASGSSSLKTTQLRRSRARYSAGLSRRPSRRRLLKGIGWGRIALNPSAEGRFSPPQPIEPLRSGRSSGVIFARARRQTSQRGRVLARSLLSHRHGDRLLVPFTAIARYCSTFRTMWSVICPSHHTVADSASRYIIFFRFTQDFAVPPRSRKA